MPDYTGPLPVPTRDEALLGRPAAPRLTLPFCRPCGAFFFYPRGVPALPVAGHRRRSRRGTLHTFTVVQRGQKGFPLPPPYVLAIVELAEGRA